MMSSEREQARDAAATLRAMRHLVENVGQDTAKRRKAIEDLNVAIDEADGIHTAVRNMKIAGSTRQFRIRWRAQTATCTCGDSVEIAGDTEPPVRWESDSREFGAQPGICHACLAIHDAEVDIQRIL